MLHNKTIIEQHIGHYSMSIKPFFKEIINMLNTTQNLGINPMVAKLQIRFLPEFEPPMSVTNELYNLLKSYFNNESIILTSKEFSQNKIKNELSKNHYIAFNFESKDNTFISKLCQIKFPNELQISCALNHISDDSITTYISKITQNTSKSLCFETQSLTAKKLRNLFPNKPDLYDKNDFFSQTNTDFDFDELSSKIYPSKQEFYKHERIVISKNE